MVVRRSSSSWSLSPETIMSHHYRLTRGVRGVVDTSPPFSMYNSPISIHYIPKRASSADAYNRSVRPPSKPQRELSDFVNGHKLSLRLPLPLSTSLNDLARPKLLGNRNYQPPLHRKQKPPIPPPPAPQTPVKFDYPHRSHVKRIAEVGLMFKDEIFSRIIHRGIYSDRIIVDTIENEMQKWSNRLSWSELETLRDEVCLELGIEFHEEVKKEKKKEKRHKEGSLGSTSSSSPSSTSSSESGSMDSESKDEDDLEELESSSDSESSTSESSTSSESSESSSED